MSEIIPFNRFPQLEDRSYPAWCEREDRLQCDKTAEIYRSWANKNGVDPLFWGISL